MHLEILTEDSSSQRLLEHPIPKLIGDPGDPHTWRIHPYRGIGRIPAGLSSTSDPSTRILLDQLPRLLRGYGNAPGIDAVVVVLDSDNRDCAALLARLRALATDCGAADRTLFRIAIEELEAWYLGDRAALQRAYPAARSRNLDSYIQDKICGTWEILAEAIYPGGVRAVRKAGWRLPGQIKHEWAGRIGPLMDPEVNQSPRFIKLRDGIRRLAAAAFTQGNNPPLCQPPL